MNTTMLCLTMVVLVACGNRRAMANFGLTGKAKLGPAVNLDLNIEADVMAREGEEGLLRKTADGTYIVPATEYDKMKLDIELKPISKESPRFPTERRETLLRSQRLAESKEDKMLSDDTRPMMQQRYPHTPYGIRRGMRRGYQADMARRHYVDNSGAIDMNTEALGALNSQQLHRQLMWNKYQRMRNRRRQNIIYRRQMIGRRESSNDKRSVDGKTRPYGKRHLYGQYRDLSRQQAVNSQSYKFPKEFQENRMGDHVTDVLIKDALKNLHRNDEDGGIGTFQTNSPKSPKFPNSHPASGRRTSNHSRDVEFFLRETKQLQLNTRIHHNISEQALSSMKPTKEINRTESRSKCEKMNLSRKQLKLCKRDPGMPQVLEEATRLAATECQYQFRYERWNCSLGSSRIFLLNKGNRETAFLFAISSAGLTHSVAKACANGHLERCSCEETYSDHLNQETWRWGGCGDNVRFASKFVRKFLKSRGQGQDIRAEVDKHNSNLGIRIVKQSVQQTCKCHGVSGSCTTKTCWRKVAPFYTIGRRIKRAYDKAVKVGSVNRANGRTKLVRIRRGIKHSKRNRPNKRGRRMKTDSWKHKVHLEKPHPTKSSPTSSVVTSSTNVESRSQPDKPGTTELVFLEKSPKYCSRSKYSVGTKGRVCDKDKNCDKICCNRGYVSETKIVKKSCECEVKWCCYVKCKTCVEERQVYTCK